jgi:DNA-binding Lrp family transcriptional regulator
MVKMWLTKNEKAVLKILLEDAKLSDTSIATKLNISTQAIGRIRKRLEEDIIKGYTLRLDAQMLGLDIISVIRFSFRSCESKTIKEIEEEIRKLPEISLFLKTIGGECEHLIVAGFRSMEDLEKFINEKKKIKGFNDYCSTERVYALPLKGVLKNSYKDIYNSLIDSCGTKNTEADINKEQYNTLNINKSNEI